LWEKKTAVGRKPERKKMGGKTHFSSQVIHGRAETGKEEVILTKYKTYRGVWKGGTRL